MAKGARSNSRKHNNAKLRAAVFAPAVDQRTERLSAKLQELSSQPLAKDADMADADFNIVDKTLKNPDEQEKEMDVDEQPNRAKPTKTDRSKRVQKRSRRKKQSITFKPHPGKVKRAGKKN